jgi:TUG ubiquitin-like domain
LFYTTVGIAGKRLSITATPMQPVRAILTQACAQLKPPADPGACKLMLGQVAVPLDEPIRFVNIPNGAQLLLVTGAYVASFTGLTG